MFFYSTILLSAIAVFAYETVIIKFPPNEVWVKVYYKKVGLESILQYVPRGQTQKNWNRAIIVHAYDEAAYPITVFMANNIALMAKNNPTSPYKYLRLNDVDCIQEDAQRIIRVFIHNVSFFAQQKPMVEL